MSFVLGIPLLIVMLAVFAWIDVVVYIGYVAPLWRDRVLTQRIMDEHRDRGDYAHLLKWSQIEEKPETRAFRRWEYVSTSENLPDPGMARMLFAILLLGEVLATVGLIAFFLAS